ncbi:hypothetical protein OGH69_12420 [Flavobacterium sp. MFBS3-15]|uniref:hypothetical protein n=1 Tax=Flavobacterium sp. MFBS3-15 TaxID=2989816 RepID=UPI0022357100|nr:hypothetical protein [Flavobacterium sp. MFBS3-15]MCW4469776.1 hypothetical protein [Flavobacterium sp. MFBS3-15]
MKKILLLFAATTMLMSCGKDAAIQDKMEKEIKSRMKNPDSYEFVSFETKEVTFKEAKEGLPVTQAVIDVSEGEEKAMFQKEYDFVKAGTDDNAVAYYRAHLTAKGTNSFGAVIQSTYSAKVLNNDTQDIIDLHEKK